MIQNAPCCKYIIVGAGLSGLQAALILTEFNKQTIGSAEGYALTPSNNKYSKRCYDSDYQWIKQMQDFPIEFEATWIGKDHYLIQYLMSNYKLNLTKHIIGHDHGKIEYVKSSSEYYRQYPQIVQMFDKLQTLYQQKINFQRKRQQKTIITNRSVHQKLYEAGEDLEQIWSCNEQNMIVLGSDFADSQFGGYMQGALLFSRKKMFEQLNKQDPLTQWLDKSTKERLHDTICQNKKIFKKYAHKININITFPLSHLQC